MKEIPVLQEKEDSKENTSLAKIDYLKKENPLRLICDVYPQKYRGYDKIFDEEERIEESKNLENFIKNKKSQEILDDLKRLCSSNIQEFPGRVFGLVEGYELEKDKAKEAMQNVIKNNVEKFYSANDDKNKLRSIKNIYNFLCEEIYTPWKSLRTRLGELRTDAKKMIKEIFKDNKIPVEMINFLIDKTDEQKHKELYIIIKGLAKDKGIIVKDEKIINFARPFVLEEIERIKKRNKDRALDLAQEFEQLRFLDLEKDAELFEDLTR